MAAGKLNTFVDEMLKHVPEENKAAVRALYSQASDEVTTIEAAAARVNTTAAEQARWWAANKDAVAERNRLQQEATNRPANTGLDEATITQRLQDMRNETLETGLGLVTTLTNIGIRHIHEFGEAIDTADLARKAIEAKQPLDVYYANSVAERRQTRDAAARAKELADATEAGHKAGVAETLARTPGGALPYPVGEGAPTTLMGLRKQPTGQATPFSLDAAVATANAVIAAQAGN